ncbi:hypothetical protein C8F01DRAFT_996450 [Mycena amicta]|nr:hypothetical protein C8F01DRAFT_996781 [Mycena amicta]KAJ7053687.1 hypothetical protein C8F01DRAFT_996450 [Mycena amicta]
MRTDEIPTSPPSLRPSTPASSSTVPFFARTAVDSLSTTSASFLTSTSPLKSTSLPPAFKTFTISPIKQTARYPELLERPPATAREQELVDALRSYERRDVARKTSMIEMQASLVLAGMYVDRTHGQLQAQEEKKNKKKSRRKMGDGKAKYFTGDEFLKLCEDDEAAKNKAEVEKADRQVQREAHAGELVAWKKENDLIRERNEAKKAQFKADTAAWETEKAVAKAEKRRPGWVKPKWAAYNAEKHLPRPKKPVDEDEDEEEGGDGSGNESGMDVDG